jgi:hypothetical protein
MTGRKDRRAKESLERPEQNGVKEKRLSIVEG